MHHFARQPVRALLSSAALAALTVSAPAIGQDEAPVETTAVDVITVTAQFREQSVLEVPLAVTAYDGEFIDAIGVDEFDELSAFVPGFVVQEQSVNNPGFVLRGITSDDGAATIEPRVSVFQNGVSISRSRGSVVPFFDLERVEVLNGPQGTLFGRSAQIGAVHVITNKANYDQAFGGSLEFGNFSHKKGSAYANIPLAEDVLALRVAGMFESREGYVDNNTGPDELNSVETAAARASLRFDPAPTLRFDVIANYVTNEPSGTSFKSGVIPALNGDVDPNTFASLNTFGGFLDDTPLSIDRELFDLTLIGEWAINDNWGLTGTLAYREFESLEVFDPDGTALDLLIFAEDAEGEQFSADARFSFDNGGRFTGFFGGGVFTEEGSQGVPLGFDLGGLALFSTFGAVPDPATPGADVFFPNSPTLQALLTGDPAVFAPSGLTQTENVVNFADNTSYDVFAEGTFDILPNLELTLGARYTNDDKETRWLAEVPEPNPFLLGAVRAGTVAGLINAGVPEEVANQFQVVSVLGGVSGGVLSSDDQEGLESEFDGFSYRAVLNYEFQPGRFAYFNYSRGRRPEVIEEDFGRDGSDADGDFIIGDTVGQFVVVPEETVDSFELGLKGNFLNDQLTVQTALYYYEYENFQTSVAVNEPGSAPEFDLINAGSATSTGWESSLNYAPSDALDVFLTYGWNESRFDDVDGDGNPQQFADNQFRLAPDHAFSAGFDFRAPVADGSMEVFIRPTYTWQSEVFFTNDNDVAFDVIDPTTNAVLFTVPDVSQDSYGLLNLNAGLSFGDGQYSVEGFVKNALDEEYIIDAGNTGGVFNIPTYIAGAPRFYGVRFKADF